MRCDDCQTRLLDLVYGLPDPAEAAALEAHVAGCPACTAAVAAARGEKALLARAAKVAFPTVQFVPPTGGTIEPRRPTPRTVLVRWAVAAGVLFAVAGTLGPTIHSEIRAAAAANGTRSALARVRPAKDQWKAEKTSLDGRTAAGRDALESAKKAHDAVVSDWVRAVSDARGASPFAVEVTGPASALAGVPNEYRVRVSDAAGRPLPAAVEVAVTDSTGKVRAEAKLEPAAVKDGATFRLPTAIWTDLPAASPLTLTLSTADPATGRKSPVAEPVNLTPPVYSTVLATDRPIYQPGETVYFRSVTLDRTRFVPPEQDFTVQYVLLDARGNVVPGMSLSGKTTAVTNKGGSEPVLGPDGKPVRGVGCG